MSENLCQRGGQEGQEVGLILNNKGRMGELPSGDVDDSAPLHASLERGYLLRATNKETVWTLHEEYPDRLLVGGRFLPTPLPNVWSLSRALHDPQSEWSVQLTQRICRKDASNYHFD